MDGEAGFIAMIVFIAGCALLINSCAREDSGVRVVRYSPAVFDD